MIQISLDFLVQPKPEAPKLANSEEHLRALVEKKECMIFLYGQNNHLCFIRTHSSDDRIGKIWPILRKTAKGILEQGSYTLRSNHTSDNGKRAKVYSPKR